MNKHDNLNDNIYLLLIRIKLIRDSLILDTDPGLFLDKTLADIDFINQVLAIFLNKMQENTQLIDRDELLNQLSELEWQFSQVLSEILNGSGNISVARTPEIRDNILKMRKSSLERRETIEIIGQAGVENPREPVLSTNELNELLKDF